MLKYLIVFTIVTLSQPIYCHDLHLADSHGPISLMGDHMHKRGEIMFSYRLNKMEMNKLFNGTKSLSVDKVMKDPNSASNGKGTYMNSPVSMKMEMHMFGAMYAPKDFLTFMIMGSYINKEMSQRRMQMAGGGNFEVNSSGIGDTRFSGLLHLYENAYTKLHLGLGLSFPTGSVDVKDNTPISSSSRLGYSMQNGTGTFDPYFLINNVNSFGRVRIGEQIFFKTNLSGKNSKNYNYGNTFDASLWTSYRWLKNLSTAIKLNYNFEGKISGQDNEMNPRMSPAMDSKNKGHQKLNLGISLNLVNHLHFFQNNRFAIEGIFPLHSQFRGIQMKEDYKFVIGWQYGF